MKQYREIVHDWLKFYPECIKFIETLTKFLYKDTREQVFQLLAEYYLYDCYPKDDPFGQTSAEVNHIASHLIYYIQFIMGQRSQLPKEEVIPVTNLYLRCYALTHSKCHRRKSDPITMPEEYSFLGEIVK